MADTRKKSNYARELKGWWLQLAAHQTADPTLLYRLVRADNFQRQAAYAAFAVAARELRTPSLGLTGEEVTCVRRLRLLNDIALLLRDHPPREVITRLYGSCDPGYLGALRRTAPTAQPPLYYTTLHGTFAEATRRSEAKVIAHVHHIDVGVLAALRTLPRAARHPHVLAFTRTGRDAERIATAIALLATVHSAFADERQFRSLVGASIDLRRLVVRAIRRVNAPLPNGPVLAGFRQITSTRELRRLARAYRNCLAEPFMTASCLSGQRAVYEVADYPVLAEIGQVDDGLWTLLGVNGIGNRCLPAHVRGAVTARLRRQGIERISAPLVKSEWSVFDSLHDELVREDSPPLLDLDEYIESLLPVSAKEAAIDA